MTCRCGCGFCYFCGSRNEAHHGAPHVCNRPEVSAIKDDLALYTFYLARYEGHAASLKHEATRLREDLVDVAKRLLLGSVVEGGSRRRRPRQERARFAPDHRARKGRRRRRRGRGMLPREGALGKRLTRVLTLKSSNRKQVSLSLKSCH